ncbi:hypothetical protein [Flaviaesturariibacter flavus]|nr:hypothetical protein [Flaviaesturariibacter flavus]
MAMSLQRMDMNMVMYPEITGGVGDQEGAGAIPKQASPDGDHILAGMQHGNMDVPALRKEPAWQISNKSNRSTITGGVQYITPFLFLPAARIGRNGKLRFQLSREDIRITSRLRLQSWEIRIRSIWPVSGTLYPGDSHFRLIATAISDQGAELHLPVNK